MAFPGKRVVIVTGAGDGIGFHLTRALLARSFLVAGLDRDTHRLHELAATCTDRLEVCECDVTDESQVEAAVEAVIERWNRIDVLVNNACLAVFEPFDREDRMDSIRREFEVNFFGYLNLIRAVLPRMKSQREGVIHNVSSGVGMTGFPGLSGYTSTKGAVEALTRTLAFELEAFGITVNLIHPPLTDTTSASPLGIPKQMMSDPARVGRDLAEKIGSREPIITPDWKTGFGLFINRHFPRLVGNLMVRQTRRVQSSSRPAAGKKEG
jgi:NAD(P)-dependent dehydrogenase (short-subunit alcohol dehydrogenase family)